MLYELTRCLTESPFSTTTKLVWNYGYQDMTKQNLRI